jgi:hypothetical protein
MIFTTPNHRKFSIAALAFMLTGCVANSGIVPIGRDTYMVSRQAATGFSGSSTLKAEAFQEANQHCVAQKKVMQVVNTTEAQPPFVFGNYPKAEVQFRCLNANDAELVRPKLKSVNNVSVEVRQ